MNDRVVIITGASHGIGREAARVLAHLGANVVIAEINADTGRETERLVQAEGGRCSSRPMSPTRRAWRTCVGRPRPCLTGGHPHQQRRSQSDEADG